MSYFNGKQYFDEGSGKQNYLVFLPGFTYSACGPFTKNKERIEKFMKTENTGFIYRNELDKACFQHDMAYGK